MIKFRFTTSLVLLVVLTLPCFGCVSQRDCRYAPRSTSDETVIPDGFGVNIDFTDPHPGELKMMAAAGLRWVRMDLKWDATEREVGRYDFSAYDRLMSALQSYNLQALFILDYGNPLYDNGAPPRTVATRQAFARWAVAAAGHFAGRGVIWEVYNEPNHSTFWPPRPNAQEYVALALEVGRAFQEKVPEERLVGPATSEIDFEFLESCFKAGLLEYWSAVSIHPYRRNDPETVARDYCRLREMITRYAPARTAAGSDPGTRKSISIISSEWGYSSAWPGISDDKQGELLARSWLTNVANGISLSIWYDWRDDGLDQQNPEHHFGTVSNFYREGRDPVYDPKPAYFAAKTLTTFLGGYRFDRRIDVGGDDDYVLVFRKAGSIAGQDRGGASAGDLRFVAWTTASGAHSVLLPVNAGSYTITGHTGKNANAVKADQKGLPIALTSAPVFIR